MRSLKALISKKTLHRAHVPKDNSNGIYCIANYDDDLDLIGNDVVTVRSRDRVIIHILNKEAVDRHAKEIDEMICDIWNVKDPKLSIEDVRNKIISNTWRKDLDKKLCEPVYFYTVKEALISKKTMHRAHAGNTYNYVIFPFGKDEQIISSMMNTYINSKDGWNFYIISYNDFKKIYPFKNDNTKVFKSEKSRDELYKFIRNNDHEYLLDICENPSKLI